MNTVHVVSAGLIGVEWVTTLESFFLQSKLTIKISPRAQDYARSSAVLCSVYMNASGTEEFNECRHDPKNEEFWKDRISGGADDSYVCIGVKTSNYFMPKKTFSKMGSHGGGWITMSRYLRSGCIVVCVASLFLGGNGGRRVRESSTQVWTSD